MVILIVALVLGCFLYGFFLEVNRFKRKTLHLTSPVIPSVWEGRKILFFSDLHLGPGMPEKRLSALTQCLIQEKPDLILFGGDWIESRRRLSPSLEEQAIPLLQSLSQSASLGCYAVRGNHDIGDRAAADLVRKLCQRAGIQLLENEQIQLEGLLLTGLSCWSGGQSDISLAQPSPPSNSFQIVLLHEPDPAAHLHPSSDTLILSGHNHNGQIKPLGFQIFPEEHALQYRHGFYSLENPKAKQWLYVSGGVGTVIIHARFLAPPEYLVLTLSSE